MPLHYSLRFKEGTGTEVQFTLFRVPGMNDEKFAADADWVVRDLNKLKELLEAE